MREDSLANVQMIASTQCSTCNNCKPLNRSNSKVRGRLRWIWTSKDKTEDKQKKSSLVFWMLFLHSNIFLNTLISVLFLWQVTYNIFYTFILNKTALPILFFVVCIDFIYIVYVHSSHLTIQYINLCFVWNITYTLLDQFRWRIK